VYAARPGPMYRVPVDEENEIGALVTSVQVPAQTNDPDITVVGLDLHEAGFVVRCKIGGSASLDRVGAFVGIELRDSVATHYERAGSGQDFIPYKPAIPPEAEWLEILTVPLTHIDLPPRS